MIGLFNDCFPPVMDGVSVAVCNYAKWLPHYGEDVCVVTPQVPSVDYSDLPYKVYSYFSLPMPRRKPYRLGIPQVDCSFANQIRQTDFDLVHAHCPFSSGHIALDIARKRGIPFIATFHSKYRQDIERYISNKFIVDMMIRRIIDFFNQADEVWIPQEAVIDTLREYGYTGNYEVVENGSDLYVPYSVLSKNICKKKLGVQLGRPMLLFVGQHILEKNVLFLIEALSMVECDYKMFFVGDGYAADLMKKEVQKRNLQEKVSFIGQITDRSLLNEYYMASDLFVFPSFYDNAPLVVREAATMHTPSLLIRDTTAAEIIKDNYNGFLSSNNAKMYAKDISTLLKNPTLMKYAGDNASETIVHKWQNIVRDVDDRYTHLMQKYNHEVFYFSRGLAMSI